VPEFAENVKNGKVVKYFIRPMDLFHQTFLQEMGNSLIYCIQVLHIFVIGFMCNILIFNSSGRIIQFMVSFLLSIVLSVLIANVFFFCIIFVTLNYSGIKALLQRVQRPFIGYFGPTDFMAGLFDKNVKMVSLCTAS